MLKTIPGNSYWDGTGAYQELFELDDSDNKLANAVRSLYYEYFNNGNWNAIEEEYNGYSKEVSITDYYRHYLEYIIDNVEDAFDAVELIIEIMLDQRTECFDAYNDLVDEVMYYISKN